MKYKNMRQATFLARPNRFIAHIEVEGNAVVAHVKNTGRCKELLTPKARLLVEEFDNPKRKTKYDVISVYKGDRLINMDSQVPNKVFREWLEKGNLFAGDTRIKAESSYGNSRFDFYVEVEDRKIFIEVKGVTLEEDGVVLFPDAPTERGLKHIKELCACLKDGYEAYVVFVIQMSDVFYFTPNRRTHAAFAEALEQAQAEGVKLLALDCLVSEDSITAQNLVEIRL